MKRFRSKAWEASIGADSSLFVGTQIAISKAMSFSLRKQTWYLLSLLAVSLLTYSFETGQALDLRDNDEYWAYKIDIQDQSICGTGQALD